MRAKVAFDHEGERLRAGQTFSTTAVQAAALRYAEKADFANAGVQQRDLRTGAKEPDPVTVPANADADALPAEQEGRRSQRYRRRDLRAEGSTDAEGK